MKKVLIKKEIVTMKNGRERALFYVVEAGSSTTIITTKYLKYAHVVKALFGLGYDRDDFERAF